MTKLVDKFDRNLNYLRISITDRCNLKCIYCEPGVVIDKLFHSRILRYEEILRLVKTGVKLGITKVRVTGGEPLIRRGVYDFLNNLSAIDGLTDISLTTNGLLLKENVEKIKSAGIKRINVSLDSLVSEKFYKITGRDNFDKVWEGIMSARDAGFFPIKINMVTLKKINDNELSDFAELTFKYPFQVRFIEYMPIGSPALENEKYQMSSDETKKIIRNLGELIQLTPKKNDGPARLYKFRGAKGEIGFISPISHHFCAECNRLRLTADGMLRTCLLSEQQTDLRAPLRNGASDKKLADIIINAVSYKPKQHNLALSSGAEKVHKQMSSIGG